MMKIYLFHQAHLVVYMYVSNINSTIVLILFARNVTSFHFFSFSWIIQNLKLLNKIGVGIQWFYILLPIDMNIIDYGVSLWADPLVFFIFFIFLLLILAL